MKFLKALLVCAALFSGNAMAQIAIATWNIQNLGHGNQKSYVALAETAQAFDLLAIQEVMNREGAEQLKQALEKKTGHSWELMYSHLLGRGSYKEKYAFLWKKATVEYVDGAVVYLDKRDQFIREPFSARFRERASGLEFVAATVHILYGKSVEDRIPEIESLGSYWQWLESAYEDTPIMLMGDFNLAPSHPAWDSLKQHARPLVESGATTVSNVDGRYANLYDNIWTGLRNPAPVVKTHVVKAPELLGWPHKKFRKHASDHVPVVTYTGNRTQVAQAHTAPIIPAPSPSKGQ